MNKIIKTTKLLQFPIVQIHSLQNQIPHFLLVLQMINCGKFAFRIGLDVLDMA